MNEEKLKEIIKISEKIGEWKYFLNEIAWDNPNISKYQTKLKILYEKRDKLIKEGLKDENDNN